MAFGETEGRVGCEETPEDSSILRTPRDGTREARNDREKKEGRKEEGGSLAANQHPGLSLVVTVHQARPLLT